jgi:hypothetical protein
MIVGILGLVWLAVWVRAEGVLIEGKLQYFHPSCTCFTDTYDSGVSFGAEIAFNVSDYFGVWAGFDRFSQTGHIAVTGEKAFLRLIPLFAGLRLQLPFDRFIPYTGIGLGYFTYKESYPNRTVDAGDVGLILQAGCLLEILDRIYLDIKGGFSRCITDTGERKANLGGMMFGLGIGVEL